MVMHLKDMIAGSGWQLATPELVVLMLAATGPGAAIQHELRGNAVQEQLPFPDGSPAGVIVPREDAARLLRDHAGEGGNFIAGHLESRAQLRECWTITVGGGWVDACAADYRCGTVFSASSDFLGTETYTEFGKDN
jgi:hypothetical protein